MLKRLAIIAALLVAAACDNTLSPNKSLTTTRARFGDFMIRAENYHIPDSIMAGESTYVTFDIGDGVDPCAYNGHVTLEDAQVLYFVPWGVHHPGASCRQPAFLLRGWFSTWRDNTKEFPPPDTAFDRAIYRVIVCLPDGSYRRKDMLVSVPWLKTKTTTHYDSSAKTLKRDAEVCRGYASYAPPP